MSVYDTIAQARTTLTAEHCGEQYSAAELELIREFMDSCTDEEIAITLGRTLFGVRAMIFKLRHGTASPAGTRTVSGGKVVLAFDRGFTTVADLFG